LCRFGSGTPAARISHPILYRGEHAESMRDWRQLLELPAVPVPLRVDAHPSSALLACFQSDLPTARRHAKQALAVGGTRPPAGRGQELSSVGEPRQRAGSQDRQYGAAHRGHLVRLEPVVPVGPGQVGLEGHGGAAD
jgi:hypothetical protein